METNRVIKFSDRPTYLKVHNFHNTDSTLNLSENLKHLHLRHVFKCWNLNNITSKNYRRVYSLSSTVSNGRLNVDFTPLACCCSYALQIYNIKKLNIFLRPIVTHTYISYGLKQGDTLFTSHFNSDLEFGMRRVQDNWVGLKVSSLNQVYLFVLMMLICRRRKIFLQSSKENCHD